METVTKIILEILGSIFTLLLIYRELKKMFKRKEKTVKVEEKPKTKEERLILYDHNVLTDTNENRIMVNNDYEKRKGSVEPPRYIGGEDE